MHPSALKSKSDENATEQARGMIVKYISYHGGTFDIKFGPEVGSAPLRGVSWAQLFGEAPVVSDVMLTLQIPCRLSLIHI